MTCSQVGPTQAVECCWLISMSAGFSPMQRTPGSLLDEAHPPRPVLRPGVPAAPRWQPEQFGMDVAKRLLLFVIKHRRRSLDIRVLVATSCELPSFSLAFHSGPPAPLEQLSAACWHHGAVTAAHAPFPCQGLPSSASTSTRVTDFAAPCHYFTALTNVSDAERRRTRLLFPKVLAKKCILSVRVHQDRHAQH
jgi:hypothetical protein